VGLGAFNARTGIRMHTVVIKGSPGRQEAAAVLLRTLPGIALFTLVLSLCTCIHTKSGNANFNRNIEIRVVSGSAYFDVSGHIGEDIFLDPFIYDKKRRTGNDKTEIPIALQGEKTINEKMVFHESQIFTYTLTSAEIVMVNIRSIDSNDVKIIVSEYGRQKEYTIDGKNQLGRTISFKN
jgi:hypothetical protein